MINLYHFFTFFLSILPSIVSQNPVNCNRSCPGGQFSHAPYPFGFSSSCPIELNCTSYGTALIGEFPIQQITPDELLVTRPTKCGRAVDSISRLYSDHYALASTNFVFMETCKERKNNCMIPKMGVGTQLENVNCSGVHDGYDGNTSCYTGNVTDMFLEYGNVTRMGCRFLIPVAESETIGDGSETLSMDMQVFKLGWWLNGSCNCSDNANCTRILSPVDGSDGYRCKCNSGFDGDGYKASSGCRNLTGEGNDSLATNEGSKGAFNTKWKLVIGFSSGIIGIMLLLFVILVRKKRLLESQKASNRQIEIFIRNNGSMTPKRFKYSEIKKMTNSFVAKLGKGGFGSVYKGQMHNGSLVAVKLLDGAMGDGEDFINEVASISKTSHVNVVTLLGFCFEGEKRALIYEFMPNGSLDKFLRGDGSRLDWNTLFKISKGIARGLEYLHQGCNTRIVHFDIKPHNILLDEEFVPKISDFGLAKLCKKKESIVSIMGARGTAGYMAPEVFFKSLGGASHKSDVYSYGMMILEMVGARKNSNACVTSTGEGYFLDWIYKQVETGENLGLDGVTSDEEEELARKMVMVSLWCIQSDPSDRPSISKVVEMLEGSLESLQVPPKHFWSSSTSSAEYTPLSALESTTT